MHPEINAKYNSVRLSTLSYTLILNFFFKLTLELNFAGFGCLRRCGSKIFFSSTLGYVNVRSIIFKTCVPREVYENSKRLFLNLRANRLLRSKTNLSQDEFLENTLTRTNCTLEISSLSRVFESRHVSTRDSTKSKLKITVFRVRH